jgi:hypothetical protein
VTENPATEPPEDLPPAWLEDAVSALVSDAVNAGVHPDPNAGYGELVLAVGRFLESCQEHDPDGANAHHVLWCAAGTCARLAADSAPECLKLRGADEFLGLGSMGPDGQPVDDIDAAAAAGGGKDRGRLAAIRIAVAVSNGDTNTAISLLSPVMQDEEVELAVPALLIQLAGQAAGRMLDAAFRGGTLTPEARAAHIARRAAETVIQTRAFGQDPGAAMPHGVGSYQTLTYVPGLLAAETVAQFAHDRIRKMADDGQGPPYLCGVEHMELVDGWRLPPDQRTAMNRELARMQSKFKRPAALLRVWQHHEPCEESRAAEDAARLPGLDDVPLFEDPALAAELVTLTEGPDHA